MIRCTDLGNSERFILRHKGSARWVEKWGRWIVWDGKRWKPDDLRAVERLAHETALAIYREAAEAENEAERKELAKHAARTEASGRLLAMLELAKPYLVVDAADLDADPWLLNCANGTLDLRTGQITEHDPANLLTKLVDLPYHPDATSPRWTAFLDYIMAADSGMIDFLQRMYGYGLSGNTDEHAVFLQHGEGANGKSTMRETMRRVLGDYAGTIRCEALLQTFAADGKSADPMIAGLEGKRLVLVSEIPADRKLNEALVKDLTGGEAISARRLYRDPMEFRPQCKFILSGQHKPAVSGSDLGIWRRLKVIPFPVVIPEDRRLPMDEVIAGFMQEAPGILTWAVQGCTAWQDGGLAIPRNVARATEAYKTEQDLLREFLDERCEQNPGDGYVVNRNELWQAFQSFAQGDPELKHKGKKWLTSQLAARGIDTADRASYHGLRLLQ